MPRPLKVYTWQGSLKMEHRKPDRPWAGDTHCYVAARSAAEAARIAGYERPRQLFNFREATQPQACEAALAKPGVILCDRPWPDNCTEDATLLEDAVELGYMDMARRKEK